MVPILWFYFVEPELSKVRLQTTLPVQTNGSSRRLTQYSLCTPARPAASMQTFLPFSLCHMESRAQVRFSWCFWNTLQ